MKTKELVTIRLAILTGLLTLLVSPIGAQTHVFARRGIPLTETLAPAYAGCGGVAAPATNAGYERELVELVNEFRADNGRPPLKHAEELNQSARYHATDMGQDDYYNHDTYDRVDGTLVPICGAWASLPCSGGNGASICR